MDWLWLTTWGNASQLSFIFALAIYLHKEQTASPGTVAARGQMRSVVVPMRVVPSERDGPACECWVRGVKSKSVGTVDTDTHRAEVPSSIADVDHTAVFCRSQYPIQLLNQSLGPCSAARPEQDAGVRRQCWRRNAQHQAARLLRSMLRSVLRRTSPLQRLAGHSSQPCGRAWRGATRSAPPRNSAGLVITSAKQSCAGNITDR